MQKTIGFLALMMLLGAGCAAGEPSQVSIESSVDLAVDSSIDSADTDEQAEEKHWVMSTGIVMLTAPEGWSVSQADGGGVSGIRVSDGSQELRILIVTPEGGSSEISTEMLPEASDDLQAIIDSIVINPSAEAQVGATIIP